MAAQSLPRLVYKIKIANEEKEIQQPYIRRVLYSLVPLATADREITLFGSGIKTTATVNWSNTGKNFFPNQAGQCLALGVSILGPAGVPVELFAGATKTVGNAYQQLLNTATVTWIKDSNLYRLDHSMEFIDAVAPHMAPVTSGNYSLNSGFSGAMQEREARKVGVWPRNPVVWVTDRTQLQITMQIPAMAAALDTYTVLARLVINDFPGDTPDVPLS